RSKKLCSVIQNVTDPCSSSSSFLIITTTRRVVLPLPIRELPMRLHILRLHGITEAFPSEIRLDFDALGPGLIALVGENGAGKSTLIGSVFAALFRQLPGQKRSLYDFATHPE